MYYRNFSKFFIMFVVFSISSLAVGLEIKSEFGDKEAIRNTVLSTKICLNPGEDGKAIVFKLLRAEHAVPFVDSYADANYVRYYGVGKTQTEEGLVKLFGAKNSLTLDATAPRLSFVFCREEGEILGKFELIKVLLKADKLSFLESVQRETAPSSEILKNLKNVIESGSYVDIDLFVIKDKHIATGLIPKLIEIADFLPGSENFLFTVHPDNPLCRIMERNSEKIKNLGTIGAYSSIRNLYLLLTGN